MNLFFSYYEGSILLRLLIAHCLTDFFLQPRYWVNDKRNKVWKSKYLWYHGILTGLIAWLFLWDINKWQAILVISVSHIIIDGLKIEIGKKINKKRDYDPLLFIADQLAHFLIIIFVWLFLISGWQKMNLSLHRFLPDYRILLRIFGYLLMTSPAGFLIQSITKKWIAELNMEDSLKDAGRWIGMLERILIITFIYINQFEAIGFLIAAKSLLRLIDRPENAFGAQTPFSSRKHTEYVLIGTFLSFAIAIITGLMINRLLQL